MNAKIKKKKNSKGKFGKRPSIMDVSSNDPSLDTYGSIGPAFRGYVEEYKKSKAQENARKDSLGESASQSGSDYTGADSGITEDYLVPRRSIPKETGSKNFMAIRQELKKRKKSKDGMKPREKERLARNRGVIVRSLDVSLIIDDMRRAKVIDKKDEDFIMDDPRRRQRAARFLDVLESKKTQAFENFLDVIGQHYPQLYLQLVDWEDDEGGQYCQKSEDEWTQVRKMRPLIIDDLDATQIMPYLQEKEVLTRREIHEIMKITPVRKQTEAFLDILETKSSSAYELFLESIGDLFPHLYLLLTERGDEDEEFDVLYG